MAVVVEVQGADRRSVRTREALLHVFLDLLFERGYEALSVRDIAARANVGRSTFYEHFAGKDALLRFSLRRPFSVLAEIIGEDPVNDRTIRLLRHFRERRKLGPVLFSYPLRPLLTRALVDLIDERLCVSFVAARATVAQRLIAIQLAEAQIALVDQWINGRIACRIESMAEALHASTNAIVRAHGVARRPAEA
ncbi:MAG: TetR/AcrR family transcriptional regulator [Alphaproteobacteria bacterium]|nr:TetR/AcrR family transcriptional regulator [Alphaproteobacteria bacterium]